MKSTKIPRLIILVLSALGIALSGYLTYLYYGKAHATFCALGSGCDIVRESSYSAIIGIPVSLFGVIGYLSILISALMPIPYRTKWLSLYFLSLVGFAFSAYLTYVEFFVIKAVCPYCVTSTIIITVILIVLLLKRPDLSPRISFAKFAILSVAIIGLVLFSSVFLQSKGLSASQNATLQIGLAKHLAKIGVVMYGSYRCPHCAAQKELFGEAFRYIKYVECDPSAKGTNPALCYEKGIEMYPTWEIQGNFYAGVRSLEGLSNLSGYKETK